MKLLKIPCLMIPALALTACGGSTGSGDPGKLRIERPAASITQPCNGPSRIPIVRNQGAQEAAWRRDRLALAQCTKKHGALVEWTEGLLVEFEPKE